MKPHESEELRRNPRSVFAVERDADGYHLSSNRNCSYVLTNATASQVEAFIAGCNATILEGRPALPWLAPEWAELAIGSEVRP